MWDLLGPGIEPVSPALAGGFLTTAPPGKSLYFYSWWDLFFITLPIFHMQIKTYPVISEYFWQSNLPSSCYSFLIHYKTAVVPHLLLKVYARLSRHSRISNSTHSIMNNNILYQFLTLLPDQLHQSLLFHSSQISFLKLLLTALIGNLFLSIPVG